MSVTESVGAGKRRGLERTLSGSFAIAVTIGGVIGLGILRHPGEIAGVVNDPFVYMSLWVLGGLFVLLSIAVVAELVGMTPRSGGTYTLVRHAYGPFAGFVIGWVDWLSFVADIALKAVVATEFLTLLVPEARPWQTPLAIIITSVFATLQLRGIVLTATVQQLAAAGIAIIVIGFSLALLIADPVTTGAAASPPVLQTGLSAWSLVLATIIFTYDGWTYPAYFSGEVKGGSGAVARACVKGVGLVIVLYVLLNGALVKSVPLSSLAGNDLALARALELAISPAAAFTVVVAAILILLAHQNLLYMGSSRILYAMSVDGLVSQRARKVGPRGNPLVAVLISWAVSIGLILVGGFEFLLHLCVFFFIILYLSLIVGVVILRKRKPENERPFKAWGHPYSTAFCLIGWAVITLFQAVSEPVTALYALVMAAASWPVYRYLQSRLACQKD
jgi:APA family basic amino acid/polyamine antiporter